MTRRRGREVNSDVPQYSGGAGTFLSPPVSDQRPAPELPRSPLFPEGAPVDGAPRWAAGPASHPRPQGVSDLCPIPETLRESRQPAPSAAAMSGGPRHTGLPGLLLRGVSRGCQAPSVRDAHQVSRPVLPQRDRVPAVARAWPGSPTHGPTAHGISPPSSGLLPPSRLGGLDLVGTQNSFLGSERACSVSAQLEVPYETKNPRKQDCINSFK